MKRKNKNKNPLDFRDSLNIWNRYDFAMCGLGEKNKIIGKIKHIKRCLKYSKQRITHGYSDMDVWNMYGYLEEMIPEMLLWLRKNRHGSPVIDGDGENCKENWDEVLDKMIFLWREANEATCSKKNKYEKEYTKALREFEKKYGMFGKKLLTKEERENAKSGKGIRVYTTLDVPEYKEITEKYMEYSKKIDRYREHCKNEAFNLTKKYFWALWD